MFFTNKIQNMFFIKCFLLLIYIVNLRVLITGVHIKYSSDCRLHFGNPLFSFLCTLYIFYGAAHCDNCWQSQPQSLCFAISHISRILEYATTHFPFTIFVPAPQNLLESPPCSFGAAVV